MSSFFRRLRARIKYRHFERDIAHEIEAHRALAQATLEAGGETRQQARWQAARLLGNTTIAREDSRAMWIPLMLQQLLQDARYALRGFRRELGFTLAAVTMLALGLGLTAGGFAFVNGLFFRGWPVPNNGDVFRVQPVFRESAGRVDDGLSYGAYRHIAANARAADYVAFGGVFVRVGTTRDQRMPGSVPTGAFVSDNFFQALGIPLQMGTAPQPEAQSQTPTVVISHQVWQSIFGGDPDVLGRTVWLDGNAAAVVGVTAPEFTGLDRSTAVFAPLWSAPRMGARGSVREAVANERTCCVGVAGRARQHSTRAAIVSELEGLAAQYRSSVGQSALSLSLPDTTAGAAIGQRGRVVAVLALFGAGALLLLALAGANVANLYLARSLRRQHEIATRLALGASRMRLVRQLLTEGLVLSSIAGVLAFSAAASVPALMTLSGSSASTAAFGPDWRVALVTALAVLAMCALVSLAPALRATRVLWRGGAAMATARTGGLRGALLAVQIAIATVLILSAALITRGIQFGISAPADFALETTTAATLEWPRDESPNSAQMKVFRANLAAATAGSPVPMGLSTRPPVSDNAGISSAVRQPESNVDYRAKLFPLTASAARLLKLRLAAGRWASDDPAALEGVVNQTLARQVWGSVSPIGHPLRLNFDRGVYTVVGVAADTHILSPGEVEPTMHVPPTNGTPVILTSNTRDAEAAVRALVASIEPTLTVRFTPLTESIKGTMEDARAGAAVAGGLGFVALLLAMIGVYSVFSYLVEERRREIGIRVALGANRAEIRMAVFRATRWAITGGLTGGLGLSVVAGLVLRRFLFGMSPADPPSYIAVGVLLLGTAMLATFVPVRRALRVNPAVTLKAE